MDRICVAVLDKIQKLSPAGRYVIIAEDEFYEDFPEGSEKSFQELDRALTVLRRGGYIDLKYSRGDMYCVAPLKEYTEEVTIPTPPPPEPVKTRKWDIVFISAFAGSALGSLIISLIFAFI